MARETVHNLGVKFGFKTPHKFPVSASVKDDLNNLTVSLYPTGHAWNLTEKSMLKAFHDAFNLNFLRLLEVAGEVLDSTIPDNENFTVADATLWEKRLGLPSGDGLDLEVRKANIKRKMAYPVNTKARQHRLFIESQLQLAGFDVYVHENTPPYKSPDDIVSVSLNSVQHGGSTTHGSNIQHGGESYSVIANSSDSNEIYPIGGAANLWSTFFIGGQNLGENANVSADRQEEFRELVLKLKPAHTVAYIFVNFT